MGNYIVAQAVQASLGQLPLHALAVGVEVHGSRIRLRFQLSEITEEDEAGIGEIVNGLETLVGDEVAVESMREIRNEHEISPTDGVRWIVLVRRERRG
ncbi:hypothetical protein [Kribbella sp. CA-247076]|uniref:hypothetical protein n=1 Tax=Kribbella sp. CA-247076 TaxID=3239941 RepID=UPI003D8DF16B